jgi:hypothetical protein
LRYSFINSSSNLSSEDFEAFTGFSHGNCVKLVLSLSSYLGWTAFIVLTELKHCLVGDAKNKLLPDCLANSYLIAATPAQPFFRRHDSIVAKDIIEQVEPDIREILRLCGVLDAEGRE